MFPPVLLYFPQREIAIPYPRKKPLLSRMGKKRLFAYASLKEGALYQNLTRSAIEFFTSAMGMRTCSMLSRSRTVTQPSAGVFSSPTV